MVCSGALGSARLLVLPIVSLHKFTADVGGQYSAIWDTSRSLISDVKLGLTGEYLGFVAVILLGKSLVVVREMLYRVAKTFAEERVSCYEWLLGNAVRGNLGVSLGSGADVFRQEAAELIDPGRE